MGTGGLPQTQTATPGLRTTGLKAHRVQLIYHVQHQPQLWYPEKRKTPETWQAEPHRSPPGLSNMHQLL